MNHGCNSSVYVCVWGRGRHTYILISLCFFVIVFGFFNGSEITLPEQGEAIPLAIGFIKGGNVQDLTSIDRRNTARFSFAIGGNASMLKHLKLYFSSVSHTVRVTGL